MSATLTALSQLLGWAYFLCWTVSFVPQVLLNRRRRAVTGLSFDFLVQNVTGYIAYLVYTSVTFSQEDPAHRSVQANDVAFASFALALTSFTAWQAWGAGYDRGAQAVSQAHKYVALVLWTVMVYSAALAAGGALPWYRGGGRYSVVAALGLVKACVSVVKYVPQAMLNYRRKSTVGWSIANVLLDLSGGALSLLQMVVDSANGGGSAVWTGAGAKLLLAAESILFDLLFIAQHYWLYPGRKGGGDPDSDERELLAVGLAGAAGDDDGRRDDDDGDGD